MSIFDKVSETKLWRDYEIFIKCYSSMFSNDYERM